MVLSINLGHRGFFVKKSPGPGRARPPVDPVRGGIQRGAALLLGLLAVHRQTGEFGWRAVTRVTPVMRTRGCLRTLDIGSIGYPHGKNIPYGT